VTSTCQNILFVITAYNVRPFLDSLVASLAAQRWTAWKAVFVDDCSTDDTLQSLQSLLDRPGKELYIDQEVLQAHLYELLQAAMLSERVARRQEIAAAIAAARKDAAANPNSRGGAT
jgi:glycosyltransferase involved in cell wall biosynthesis